jgi:glucokinase
MKLLVADLGGTNTRLAIFENGSLKRNSIRKIKSSTISSVKNILERDDLEISTVDAICFAVAGQVSKDQAKLTNLKWSIDLEDLQKLNPIAAVFLINDLEASVYSISSLQNDQMTFIQRGCNGNGRYSILSPGTGLGEAIWIEEKTKIVLSTEGGHSDFAPRNELEWGLYQYLNCKYDHVSYERVLSGKGLEDIYAYLLEINQMPYRPILASEIAASTDSLADQTKKIFFSILGAEASNLALKSLSMGGVYIGGGIVPKMITEQYIKEIVDSFCFKGRFNDLLKTIPLCIIHDEYVSLDGAGKYAEKMLRSSRA